MRLSEERTVDVLDVAVEKVVARLVGVREGDCISKKAEHSH